MSRHSQWNLIASGASGDVAIDVAQSLQHDDRYSVSIFVGDTHLDLLTRDLDWLGTWLGILSLELGRGVDESSTAEGIQNQQLELRRDGAGFQLQSIHSGTIRVVSLSPMQGESFRTGLAAALRELAFR